MSALARKICMLGDFGVGKTSLVSRFVRNTFSEKYLTTVGVKVDSKEVDRGGRGPLKLVVWDIAGKSALDALNMSYLRGASGLLLVADGTREANPAHGDRPASAVAQPVARGAGGIAGQQARSGRTLGSRAGDPGRAAQDPAGHRDQRALRRWRGAGVRGTGAEARRMNGCTGARRFLARGGAPHRPLPVRARATVAARIRLGLAPDQSAGRCEPVSASTSTTPQAGARQLQDLFIGMSLDETRRSAVRADAERAQCACASARSSGDGFQVLLLDAQGEHDRQQAQQQTGNEAALVGYQKGKAIAQLRQIRSELEQQRARLQEANALKNALIATLSHDFRTPLTSVFGYLHLLETRVEPGSGRRHPACVARGAGAMPTICSRWPKTCSNTRAPTRVRACWRHVETDLHALVRGSRRHVPAAGRASRAWSSTSDSNWRDR